MSSDNMGDYIARSYHYYVYEKMDPNVKGLFMMGSPLPFLLLLFSYMSFVKWIGPWWMKNRPPYNVEKPMLLYNIVQMIINSYFLYMSLTVAWLPGRYNIICQKTNYDSDPTHKLVVANFYLFMWSRLLDFMDTVFMVLKKNNHQASFLHIYHHLCMGIGSWIVTKYRPGGNVVFLGTINSFVHIVMYFYYFLTAYDSSYKKSIWWKKHLTQLQLVQFVIVLTQQTLAVFSESCDYPRYVSVIFMGQTMVILYLFTRFYKISYVGKKSAKHS